ncbi:hypothetical protein JCM16138_03910 [Thermococcus atlanticus]
MGGIVEVKVSLTEEELKKLIKDEKKRKAWSKLFGIAENLPGFQESDRVDVRI